MKNTNWGCAENHMKCTSIIVSNSLITLFDCVMIDEEFDGELKRLL